MPASHKLQTSLKFSLTYWKVLTGETTLAQDDRKRTVLTVTAVAAPSKPLYMRNLAHVSWHQPPHLPVLSTPQTIPERVEEMRLESAATNKPVMPDTCFKRP